MFHITEGFGNGGFCDYDAVVLPESVLLLVSRFEQTNFGSATMILLTQIPCFSFESCCDIIIL